MNHSKRSSKGSKKPQPATKLEYLDLLVVEYQTTKSIDAKYQVLANLANFAYDPLNYNYFRQLNILDLFIDNLSDKDEKVVNFSVGGLCNLCLDPINKAYINQNGLKQIIKLLELNNEGIKLSVLTTLMFLMTPESKKEIINTAVIKSILKLSEEKNVRLRNLAKIFLKDYCTEEQIKQCSSAIDSSEIPLS